MDPSRAPKPQPLWAVPLDAAERIDADVACIHCGYNLRTLHPDGMCPECGHATAESIHYDEETVAWLATTATEIRTLAILTSIEVVVAAVSLLVFIASKRWTDLGFIVAPAPFLAVFAAVALTRMTRRDPRSDQASEGQYIRRGIRWCLLILPVVLVLKIGSIKAAQWLALSDLDRLDISRTINTVCALLLGIAGIFLPPLVFLHITNLTKRLGRIELARNARRLFWLTLVAQVGLATCLLTDLPASVGPPVPVPPMTVVILLVLVLLSYLALVSRLLFRAGKAMDDAHWRVEEWRAAARGTPD